MSISVTEMSIEVTTLRINLREAGITFGQVTRNISDSSSKVKDGATVVG